MTSYPVAYPLTRANAYGVSPASLGRVGTSGQIQLSNASFTAGSAQGTAIGTLSVTGGTGTYTFTLTDSATNKAQVAGTNGVNLQAGSASASASTFNVTVHADNGAGSTYDRTFTLTAWAAVANTVAPAIAGSPVQGVTLSVSNGTWSGFPAPSYSYQWKRAGSPISGATSSTYALQGADVGSAITCTVTASNGFSSANATSAATASVTKTTLSYTPVTSATQGAAYTGATPSTTNGTSPYTYSVTGSLPAGLSVNSSTGVISGTPTTVQTASGLALVATDANGVTDSSASFSIAVASSSVPTAFVLTDIASGRLFQRAVSTTAGPVSASGTYTGGNPSAIELQIRKVSDNSIVMAWTAATATIGSGAWSASITGVAQGGSYYVEARPSNATGLAQTGSNPFFVGIMIVMYGQSNMLNMTGAASSPPAANAGTAFFNGSAWTAVPNANGVRELLNGVQSATGVPCAAIMGAVNGVPVGNLMKGAGTGYYEALAAKIAASTNDFEFIVWHQGEADSVNGTAEALYQSRLDTIHGDLTADFGRTKTTASLVLAGLATITGGASGFGTDASWDQMERTLLNAPSALSGVYYSHSNRDATIVDANVHYDGTSYGRAGKRYARAISTFLGATSGYPNWHIASSAVVDATTTTVDLTHGLGADFTPTSGITGFDVSGDNGANWSAATGVRTSATRITLTHASVATSSLRKLRYQYGLLPDMSAPVLDNSSLALPLDNSAGALSPTPLASLPVPTFRTRVTVSGGTSTVNLSQAAINIVNAAADLLLIVGITGSTQTITGTPTITPSGGSAINGAVVKTDGTNAGCHFVQFTVPNGTNLTNATLAFTLSSAPFNTQSAAFWTVPIADLSSTAAVDKQTATSASAQTATATLATSSGGFVIAISSSGQVTSNTNTWSGTESYAERYDLVGGGKANTGADASGTASNASSSVTATWTGAAAALRVTAVSYR